MIGLEVLDAFVIEARSARSTLRRGVSLDCIADFRSPRRRFKSGFGAASSWRVDDDVKFRHDDAPSRSGREAVRDAVRRGASPRHRVDEGPDIAPCGVDCRGFFFWDVLRIAMMSQGE